MIIKGFFNINKHDFKISITFNLKFDNFVFIVGESGSGKTTFLKCITGLIKPQKSFLCINNIIYQSSKNNFFIPTHHRRIGYVSQTPVLYNYMSVLNNLKFGLKNNCVFKLDELIFILKLKKILNRNIYKLSGGEKQRVVLAQVLLSNPQFLLLDEVLSNQDFNMKQYLLSFFFKLSVDKNIPIIYVSHDIINIDYFLCKVVYLNNGKIVNIS